MTGPASTLDDLTASEARDAARARFLTDAGFTGPVRPLPSDASFRRYFRLSGAMLMDCPPDKVPLAPYLAMRDHLARLGFSVPAVLARDLERGFAVIEDFGDDTYARLLDRGGDPMALYALATDVAAAIGQHPDATAIALPPYDEAFLLREVGLVTEWYLPWRTGNAVPEPVAAGFADAWRSVLGRTVLADPRALPDTLVLRDFHVDNLMLLPGRPGIAACGLLDFQDAVIGPPVYDLVSLVEDARRDVPDTVRTAMIARYRAATGMDRDLLDTWCAVHGAQRHSKVLGLFVRLARRDGKDVYLRHLPRVMGLLKRSLAHPVLAPVARWAATHLE